MELLESMNTLPVDITTIVSNYGSVIECRGELESVVQCQLTKNSPIHDVCFYKSKLYTAIHTNFVNIAENPPMNVFNAADGKFEKTLPFQQDLSFCVTNDEIFLTKRNRSGIQVFDLNGNLKRVWPFSQTVDYILKCNNGQNLLIFMMNNPNPVVYDLNGNLMYNFEPILTRGSLVSHFANQWPDGMVAIYDLNRNFNLYKHGKLIQQFSPVCFGIDSSGTFVVSPLQEIFAISRQKLRIPDGSRRYCDIGVFRLKKTNDELKPFELVLQRTLKSVSQGSLHFFPDGRLCIYDYGTLHIYK